MANTGRIGWFDQKVIFLQFFLYYEHDWRKGKQKRISHFQAEFL